MYPGTIGADDMQRYVDDKNDCEDEAIIGAGFDWLLPYSC